MSMNVLFRVFLCSKLLTVAWGAQLYTDAGPTDFPYMVRLMWKPSGEPVETDPGLFVSSNYILGSDNLLKANADIAITDQAGVNRTAVKQAGIVSAAFVYLKVCDKYKGSMYPMKESSFTPLTKDNTPGKWVFYTASSPVPKVQNASLMDDAACTTRVGASRGNNKTICAHADSRAGYCDFILGVPNELHHPMISIKGQPSGHLFGFGCDGVNAATSAFESTNIGFYRTELIDPVSGIPQVDITA